MKLNTQPLLNNNERGLDLDLKLCFFFFKFLIVFVGPNPLNMYLYRIGWFGPKLSIPYRTGQFRPKCLILYGTSHFHYGINHFKFEPLVLYERPSKLVLLHLILYEVPHCDFHHIEGNLLVVPWSYWTNLGGFIFMEPLLFMALVAYLMVVVHAISLWYGCYAYLGYG
jgi:hypothetical protein